MLDVKKCGISGEIKGIELDVLVNCNNKAVANANIMYIYSTDGVYKVLFSYGTIICILKSGYIYRLGKNWDYSTTTGKHRNLFLKLNKKEIDKFIKDNMKYCSDIEQYVLKEVE